MPQPRLRRYFRHGTLPQLAVFEASARLRSFTRAADELHLAQPTVSAQIRKLTDTIGTPLFEQVGRNVRLTDAGRRVHEHCLEVLAVFTRLDDSLQSFRQAVSGELRLAIAGAATGFVTQAIASYGDTHPDVSIVVRIENRTRLLERLAAREDDLYLFADPPEAGDIVRQPVLANPLVVVASPGHRWARARGLKLVDLAREPLVVREPGSGTRARVLALFAQAGLAPTVRIELASDDAVRQAIGHGAGLGIVPRQSSAPGSAALPLAELDVEGFPLERYWHFAYSARARLTPAAGAFLQHVREATRTEAPAAVEANPADRRTDLYATRAGVRVAPPRVSAMRVM
ncbi:MAG: LysR family transcriptional regulator [Burkholderiales bacterium]|nr:LysR family transcriptional regulator [Burkholderiales bacterium]